jgi:hypothetical protein
VKRQTKHKIKAVLKKHGFETMFLFFNDDLLQKTKVRELETGQMPIYHVRIRTLKYLLPPKSLLFSINLPQRTGESISGRGQKPTCSPEIHRLRYQPFGFPPLLYSNNNICIISICGYIWHMDNKNVIKKRKPVKRTRFSYLEKR